MVGINNKMDKTTTFNNVHVEISLTKRLVQAEHEEIKSSILIQLPNFTKQIVSHEEIIRCDKQNNCGLIPGLSENVKSFSVNNSSKVPLEEKNIVFHFYKLNDRGPELDTFETGHGSDVEEVPALNHWLLPNLEFDGLWESLHYEDGIKDNILKFVQTMMLFSKEKVDSNIISCNRMVLLHGPPGTGKTSLCKAIAQKLSIRMGSLYKFTHLIEINSHSLFSKWFSESGKLVMKLFTNIKTLVEHSSSLVCVLIDEVESIAYARSSVSGDEPRDALRVVNAVLTQLDQIRKYPNVLILTTSNLTSTIDLAFIDRADIKQYIGYPSIEAIFEIYSSALRELHRVNILTEYIPISFKRLNSGSNDINGDNSTDDPSHELLKVCKKSIGMSGRTLRKIPFLAHALFIGQGKTNLKDFINAMEMAVDKNLSDHHALVAGQ